MATVTETQSKSKASEAAEIKSVNVLHTNTVDNQSGDAFVLNDEINMLLDIVLVLDLNKLAEQELEKSIFIGQNKGIEGRVVSNGVESVLMGMFGFNTSFDYLFDIDINLIHNNVGANANLAESNSLNEYKNSLIAVINEYRIKSFVPKDMIERLMNAYREYEKRNIFSDHCDGNKFGVNNLKLDPLPFTFFLNTIRLFLNETDPQLLKDTAYMRAKFYDDRILSRPFLNCVPPDDVKLGDDFTTFDMIKREIQFKMSFVEPPKCMVVYFNCGDKIKKSTMLDKIYHKPSFYINMVNYVYDDQVGVRACDICSKGAIYRSKHSFFTSIRKFYCESCRTEIKEDIEIFVTSQDEQKKRFETTVKPLFYELFAIVCMENDGAFVKTGTEEISPWFYYKSFENDNPQPTSTLLTGFKNWFKDTQNDLPDLQMNELRQKIRYYGELYFYRPTTSYTEQAQK